MKEGQRRFYITVDTLAAAGTAQQLGSLQEEGHEVLLMTDRVDEWALNYLHEFDGTPLQSVVMAPFNPASCKTRPKKGCRRGRQKPSSPCWLLKEALKDKTETVRVTTRPWSAPRSAWWCRTTA